MSFAHPPLFIPLYVHWHYTLGLADYVRVWWRFLGAIGHMFSVRSLIGSLFSPLRRIGETYPKGLDLGKIGEVLVINTLMRLVGFLVRAGVLLVAVAIYLVTLVGGFIGLALWLVLPAALPVLLVFGVWLAVF